MLTAQQQVFVQAIEELDLPQVQRLLAEGLDPNFIEAEMIAFLSARSYYDLPITFPKTTGVKVPLCGGKLIEPCHKKPT